MIVIWEMSEFDTELKLFSFWGKKAALVQSQAIPYPRAKDVSGWIIIWKKEYFESSPKPAK